MASIEPSSDSAPNGRVARAALLALFVSMTGCTGCNDAPADVRPWTAADHEPPPDRPIAPQTPRRAAPAVAPGVSAANAAAQATSDPTSGARAAAGVADPALVEVAWVRNCARCHGAAGAGDGPEAPMFRPPNLADPAFTAARTDEEISAAITQGRGKMPKFDLPPDVVRGLVGRVRSLGSRP